MQRYRVLVYSQSMSVMSVVCIMISVYVMFHWSESEQDTPEIPLVQQHHVAPITSITFLSSKKLEPRQHFCKHCFYLVGGGRALLRLLDNLFESLSKSTISTIIVKEKTPTINISIQSEVKKIVVHRMIGAFRCCETSLICESNAVQFLRCSLRASLRTSFTCRGKALDVFQKGRHAKGTHTKRSAWLRNAM